MVESEVTRFRFSLSRLAKEFDESGFILAAVGKQFKIVALFAQKLTEGDILSSTRS